MKKSDEIANPESCFNRAGPDTEVFVLLDWDPATPQTIRTWAIERLKRGLNKSDDPQIAEAFASAERIENRMAAVRGARKKVEGNPALNPAAAWPFPEPKGRAA